MKKALCILLLLLVAPPAFAQKLQAPAPVRAAAVQGGLNITSAYALTTAPGQGMGAAFVTISNDSAISDRLTGAAAPTIADKAELHKNSVEDNKVTMTAVDGIDVPARTSVIFDPAGYHVMLMGLHAQLKEGQVFPLKLTFAKKGEISVDVTVRPPDVIEPSGEEGGIFTP